ILTGFGSIKLATTGAGDITVTKPLNSGNAIDIAVAPGSQFTNSTPSSFELGFPSAGLDTTASNGTIAILADRMSLAAGTIDAGSGPVALAPRSPTGVDIALGGSGSGLSLQQADLVTISAGGLQLGYRDGNGTLSSFTA